MLNLILSKLYAGIAQRYRSHCLSLLVLAAFFLAGGELDLQFYLYLHQAACIDRAAFLLPDKLA